MSLIAQTVAGKFETADVLFLIAFLCASCAFIIDAVTAPRPPRSLLMAAAVALIACAFWIS